MEMRVIFAAAYGKRYQKKLDSFPKTVAGFKQMFLYLQPLLKQSSFTD